MVEDDRHYRCRDRREGSVVVAEAATQPVAVPVNGQRRNECHVDVADSARAEPLTDWLLHSEWSWLDSHGGVVAGPVEILAVDDRNDHFTSGADDVLDQRTGRRFGAGTEVARRSDRSEPTPTGVSGDPDAGGDAFVVGKRGAARENVSPDRMLSGASRRALLRHSISVPPITSYYCCGMTPGVTKAVVPVAGLGTRFLPATKAIPKEMLPVIDKPAIQYVVEEAVRAGLHDILFVTGRNKTPLEDHFDRNVELEEKLEGDEGKSDLLDRVRHAGDLATIYYVRQGEPRGLGHAVLCGAQHVGREPFAVLLGDDLMDERDVLLSRMIDVQQRLGGCVVALMEVPTDQISLYGCAAVSATDESDVVQITGLVEKPSPTDAPSNLAIIGRYVLSPEIFDVLRQTPPGRGGEIQLTDAIEELTDRPDDGGPVHGVVFHGRRYDTGDKTDYLKSIVQLACDRADLGPEFRRWLADFVATGLTGSGPDRLLEP